MSGYEYLKPEVAAVMTKSDSERIAILRRDKAISTVFVQGVMKELDRLITGPRKIRPKGIVLDGPINSGKTTIINMILKKYPVVEGAERKTIPVISVDVVESASINELYRVIIDELGGFYKERWDTSKLRIEIKSLISSCQTKLICLDELTNIEQRGGSKLLGFLCSIKETTNFLKIPLFITGSHGTSDIIRKYTPLAQRFKIINYDKMEYNIDYKRFLASYETYLPLQIKSNLTNKDIATKILVMSEGIVGEISDILTAAAEFAIDNKIEAITVEVLDKLGYVPQSLTQTIPRYATKKNKLAEELTHI